MDYNLHREMYPYGKPCKDFGGLLVIASLSLWYTKNRRMTHSPRVVRGWLDARIARWNANHPEGSAAE